MLLVAPGLTRNKKLLGAKGITRSKDAPCALSLKKFIETWHWELPSILMSSKGLEGGRRKAHYLGSNHTKRGHVVELGENTPTLKLHPACLT